MRLNTVTVMVCGLCVLGAKSRAPGEVRAGMKELIAEEIRPSGAGP